MASRHVTSLCMKSPAVLLRGWLAFSVVAFATAAVFAILDHDNPLRSDDPYIPGCIAGVCCAIWTMAGSGARMLGASRIKELAAYFLPAMAASAAMMIIDLTVTMPEGHGIPTMIGVLIAASSLVAYPVMRIRLSKLTVLIASIPGCLFLLGYLCAFIVMGTRDF